MAGRPKANIDWKIVDKYLQAQCNSQGIASILGIAEDTLRRRCEIDHNMNYSEYCRLKKESGLEMLRAKQYSTAMAGDKTMLVWLGKQYLDQSESHRVDSSISVTIVDDI